MLELKGITKIFGEKTQNEKLAVSNISLALNKGDFVTIIGGNGAGKSTLLSLIAGSLLPDSGSIMLDSRDITYEAEHKRAREIGRLFQDPLKSTAPTLTILENLELACGRQKQGDGRIGKKQRQELFYEKLKALDLGLHDRMGAMVGLLSGGQRQALGMLMATVSAPKLLLLDEHTAALDPKTADKVLSLTERIVGDNGITTMMITHNIRSAISLGNRMIMLDEGQCILDIKGGEKKALSVEEVLKLFYSKSKKELDNDRMLLS